MKQWRLLMRTAILAFATVPIFMVFQNCSGFQSLSARSQTSDAAIDTTNDIANDPATTKTPTTPTPKNFTFTSSVINSIHRYQAGTMAGGWGAHLGHLIRSAAGELWFVDDTGNDPNRNMGLGYYRLVNGAWIGTLTQAFPSGRVQQNTGSLMSANVIYTYGLDVENNKIVECYFDTANATYSYHACNSLPFDTGANSNYIGATISKSGSRVVWWTNVGGGFSYIYNFGGGWNGPIASTLSGYADFSYVYARLADDNSHIDFLGAAARAVGNSSVGYDVVYGSTTLGNAISNWSLFFSGGIGMETWADPSGGLHFLTYGSTTPSYFYRAKDGGLTNQPPLPDGGIIGARIVETATEAHLVMAFADGTIKFKTIEKTKITGAINWSALPNRAVTLPAGLGPPTLYPESAMYQTTSPIGLNFAVNGYNQQHLIYFVQGN